MNYHIPNRPRRLRSNSAIRSLVEETHLRPSDFVLPVFISDEATPTEVPSMPGVFRWPVKLLEDQLNIWRDMGIKAFALFPKIEHGKKDPLGSEILNPDGLVYRASKLVKKSKLDVLLIADLALDPYTNHGQDGVLNSDGTIDNDQTIEKLAKAALMCAESGFEWVAPSDMMDGRVGVIRNVLDENSFTNTGIISYSAKFASSYYGPFRSAIKSEPKGKTVDKKSYQLNPSNFKEAKRELFLDLDECADMLMIKPAEPYLDVIHFASNKLDVPIAAYQVSGEYSRIMAAHQLGWLDWRNCALESLVCIKRAGANLIFTYFADRIAGDL
jgi:porphobilinogen synthase